MQSSDFLQDGFIETYSRLCGVREETTQEIIAQKKELPVDAVQLLKDDGSEVLCHLSAELRPVAAYLLALKMVPDTIQRHKEKHIPWKITSDTLSDIAIWSNDYRNHSNGVGIDPEKLTWLMNQPNLTILRIGRLQYITEPCFGGKIKVFRNRKTSEVKVFAEGGLAMDRNGQRDDHADFVTSYSEDDSGFTGNPVEKGFSSSALITLKHSLWKKILEYGDPMLSIHIPADGPMTPENCLASMRDAASFFDTVYPVNWKGFWCHSWLLDPFLQEILPATSNIVQFQMHGTLYPVSGESEILSRLNQSGKSGKTKLYEVVKSALSAGKTFHNGGWFLLREQLHLTESLTGNALSVIGDTGVAGLTN